MNGLTYHLVDPNASSIPEITNIIFGSDDNLSEIDVRQDGSGALEVSYMKFRSDPTRTNVNIDQLKVFEKASFSIENPPAYFFSKNRGCHN